MGVVHFSSVLCYGTTTIQAQSEQYIMMHHPLGVFMSVYAEVRVYVSLLYM